MDWDEIRNFDRRPSINASYQVSVHLPSSFREEDISNSTNQKKPLPVAAMFVDKSGRNSQFR
jgi:hypothetical protein